MIRLGIWKLDQLRKKFARPGKQPAFFPFSHFHRSVSILLYEELARSAPPDQEFLQEQILESFSNYVQPQGKDSSADQGAFKRTYAHRFEAFDQTAADLAQKHLQGVQPLAVHDLGVSDGRTSVDFYRVLKATAFKNPRYLATDTTPYVDVISRPGRRTRMALDPEGRVVQIIRAPFVLNFPKQEHPLLFPVNWLVRKWLLAYSVPRMLKSYQTRPGDFQVERIYLVAKECKSLMGSATGFQVEPYNVLQPMGQRFHLIRAMNVLNPSYFPPIRMAQALQNILNGLEEGGLFVTGSNQGAGSPVDGAIYKKTEGRFHKLFQSGQSSPVESVLLAQG